MSSAPKARHICKESTFNQQFRRIDAICGALHRAVMAELTAETLEKRLETERVKTQNKTRATAIAQSTATACLSGKTAPPAINAVADGGSDGDEHGSVIRVSDPSAVGCGAAPSCACFSNAPGGGRISANSSQSGLEVDGISVSLPCGHGGAALDNATDARLSVRKRPHGDRRQSADINSDCHDGDGGTAAAPAATAARALPPSLAMAAAEGRMGVPPAVSTGIKKDLPKSGQRNSFTFLEDLLRTRHPKGLARSAVSRGPPPKAKRKSLAPRGTSDDGSDERRSSKKPKKAGGAAPGPFSGLSLCVVHLGSVTKNTIKAFARGVRDGGGQLSTLYTPGDTTHIVVDASLDAIWDKLDLYFSGWDDFEDVGEGERVGAPDTVPIVSSAWMSECLRLSSTVALDAYRLTPPPRSKTEPVATATKGKRKEGADTAVNNTDAARDGLASSAAATAAAAVKMRSSAQGREMRQSAWKEENHERDVRKPVDGGTAADVASATSSESMMVKGGFGARNPNVGAKKHKFLCQMSSSVVQKVFNKEAADMLERLAELCAARGGDGSVFRERGFKNAAGALKRLGVEITDIQQLKDLRRSEPDRVRGIGDSVIKELDTFYAEGKMHRLDGMEADPKLKCLELFNKISWVGEVTAQKLYSEGMRSIEDVRERGQHLLNEQARICLSRHEDISQRMPRAEAAEIEAMVTKVAQSISPGVICQACGSYRRGKSHCGDVDVLIRPPEGQEDSAIFHELIEKLTESGFVTDHLAVPKRQYTPGKSQTFMGICKLPGNGRLHRRLDIKLYPTSMFAFAVLYFTGSGHFNMSMRSFAKIKGLKLSDKGLCRVNSVGGKEVHKFPSYRCLREVDVFNALGLEWREPKDRDGVQVEAYTSWGAEGAVELSGRVVPMTLAQREEDQELQAQRLPTEEEGCFHANTNQQKEQQLTQQMRGQAELFFLEQEQLRQAINLSRSVSGAGQGSTASAPRAAEEARGFHVDGAPGDDQLTVQEALRRSVADLGAVAGPPVRNAGAEHNVWEKPPPEAMAEESKGGRVDAAAAASEGGRGVGAGSEHSPVCL